MNNTQPSNLFFKFTKVYNPKGNTGKAIYSRCGVAWDQIERYYQDPSTGNLYISTKSMTEAYEKMEVKEGKNLVQKDVKVPTNVTLLIDSPDDIKKFFELLDHADITPVDTTEPKVENPAEK